MFKLKQLSLSFNTFSMVYCSIYCREILHETFLVEEKASQKKSIRSLVLKMFALIGSAHPYCARNSYATSCIERALSCKMNNNKANGHCYTFA